MPYSVEESLERIARELVEGTTVDLVDAGRRCKLAANVLIRQRDEMQEVLQSIRDWADHDRDSDELNGIVYRDVNLLTDARTKADFEERGYLNDGL